MMPQKRYENPDLRQAFAEITASGGISHLMVVSGHSCSKLPIADAIRELPVKQTWFSEFRPNPDIESVRAGVRILQQAHCDGILAIGGGSAMDVAKGIKMFANCDPDGELPVKDPAPNAIPFTAIPTTAGTGSEATRFAVVYKDHVKQSLTAEWFIPDTVIMVPELLTSLPAYQKKCTVLDALCHAIESFWSVNSTDESKEYAREAIHRIRMHLPAYLENDAGAAVELLVASNFAGKAINITQTTAGHAMCYKITTLTGIPHGHAAALCVRELWPYMLAHTGDCIDSRGEAFLRNAFAELAEVFLQGQAGGDMEAADTFAALLESMEIRSPGAVTEEQMNLLVSSVNPDRLKNNPVRLSEEAIRGLYQKIFSK